MASEGGNKSFARRDRLREIESKVQKWWEEKDVFRAEPGEKPPSSPGEKFFGNFPFPYMNGYLHLGHAFSLSKLEFAAAYHRLCGANVLLPYFCFFLSFRFFFETFFRFVIPVAIKYRSSIYKFVIY